MLSKFLCLALAAPLNWAKVHTSSECNLNFDTTARFRCKYSLAVEQSFPTYSLQTCGINICITFTGSINQALVSL